MSKEDLEILVETTEDGTYISSLAEPDVDSSIAFCTADNVEAVRIEEGGKFFVHGKEVAEDIELYKAFVKFFTDMGLYNE